MPEMRFDIRWPDGKLERCYSPSLIIRELLPEGRDYPVFEFTERVRAALTIASERVRLKYGFECSAALDQLSALQERAQDYAGVAAVSVLAFHTGGYLPPLASGAQKPLDSGEPSSDGKETGP